MPEGPEVRIIADSIATFLVGGTLTTLEVIVDAFRKRTKGLDKLHLPKQVQDVKTKGKFCYILLDDMSAITIGFGMDGNVRIEPDEEYLKSRNESRDQYMKHCAVKFVGNDGTGMETTFYYHTARRFGFMNYLSSSELQDKLKELGPCILDPKQGDDDLVIKGWRKKNSRPICDVLLNYQDLCAGIGNYIKCEILYECKIHPCTLVKDLSDSQLRALYNSAVAIAEAAYKSGGASLYTFTGLHGDRSPFKHELKVYDKKYDPLGNKVEKMETPDKRTTHLVSVMQYLTKAT